MGCVLLLSLICPADAQNIREEFEWNSVTYLRLDDGWYAKGVNDIFKVAEYSVSARLRDTDHRDDVVALLSDRGLTLVRENRLNIMDIHLPAGSDIMKTVRDLSATEYFRYVEPNVIGKYSAMPNDPSFSNCWGLNNTGQTGGTNDADIDGVEAWDIETGDPGIIVAVLDSGTEYTHEDLQSNIWNNADETPGNGVDDDGNGYVDDVLGWDFEGDDNDPTGSFYHGTHVAGCVAAASNNGIGIAGIAGGWGGNPGASLMICMVGSSAPIGEILDDAILYAADNGARVITLSLTVSQTTAIDDAVTYAYNTAGAFIDCASGNGYGAVAYPANLPLICAVGATDDTDTKADFSNYGPELELTAPGVDVYSTVLNDGYDYSDGTSFAAPHVAGVAAVILSAAPSLTNQEVRELMWNTSDDLGAAGFDNLYGYGRVNAWAALQQTSGLYLDSDAYPCQGTLGITVRDNSASGTVTVDVSSTTESTAETVTLTEGNPGEFTGTIAVDTVPAQSGDSIISVADGDIITVDYTPLGETATAPVDCTTPMISGVTVGMVSESQATVQFTTDEPCYGSVVYGETSPGTQLDSMNLTTSHSIVVTGLNDCTYYEFYVMASDPAGNTATDDNGGANYSFVTLEIVAFLEANMDTDPGWTYEGQWAWGVPQGNQGDPSSGYTRSNVVGYNLAGSYPNNLPETYCTTQSFDCSTAGNVYFSFYKWLGIESSTWDHASIDISNNGGSSWNQIWDHTGGSTSGGSWEYVEFDISTWAAGYSDVQIRWVMGTTDSSVTYCGWNVDDVLVSFTQPCDPPTPTPNPCIHDGDVNMSGSLTAGDAQLAFQIALGLYSPTYEEGCAADCNGDDSITAGDAQQIFMGALGMGSCVDPL